MTESTLVKRWIAPPQHYMDHAKFYRDCPESPNGVMNTPLKQRVRDKGIRVLLTGCGGDEWFWGRDCFFADLIKNMRFGELSRLWLADERNVRQKGKVLLRYGIWPVLPKGIQSRVTKLAGRGRRSFPWISPQLLSDSSLEDRINATRPDEITFASFEQEEVYRSGVERMDGSQFGD